MRPPTKLKQFPLRRLLKDNELLKTTGGPTPPLPSPHPIFPQKRSSTMQGVDTLNLLITRHTFIVWILLRGVGFLIFRKSIKVYVLTSNLSSYFQYRPEFSGPQHSRTAPKTYICSKYYYKMSQSKMDRSTAEREPVKRNGETEPKFDSHQ